MLLAALAAFQRLGSVGLETARDLVLLGFRRVEELVGGDPALYRQLERLTRSKQDPCVEDALRCAVAQAEEPDHPTEWRDWWHWTPLRGAPGSARPRPAGSAAGRQRRR